jgi:hypothetical protein
MTALVFCVDPDPFDYFRYAFKKNRIGMAFYYTYAPILLSITIIVFMLPNYTWASLLPLSLVIPFVLLYRPYK